MSRADTLQDDASAKVVAEVLAERRTHAGRGWCNDHEDIPNVHHLVTLAERTARRSDTGYYERADLVKAASLLVAAIERMDRIS